MNPIVVAILGMAVFALIPISIYYLFIYSAPRTRPSFRGENLRTHGQYRFERPRMPTMGRVNLMNAARAPPGFYPGVIVRPPATALQRMIRSYSVHRRASDEETDLLLREFIAIGQRNAPSITYPRSLPVTH
ncbi:hypothetical protein B0H11DRAFT_359573 [Mycena galericulata]|nr:hypothetical protein B0H11DRAFT_359573 [Mycena galericulata]